MKKIIRFFVLYILFCLCCSCKDLSHQHEFVDGKCNCGIIDSDYIEPHVHDLIKNEVKPTCTLDGKILYSCDCGYEEEEVLSATGHTFIDGVCFCGEISEVKVTYTVVFLDYDGAIIKTNEYNLEDIIEYPNDPVRDGYQFVGWSSDQKLVDSNLTITALYNKIETKVQTASEWLDNIVFGINYFNGINENNDNEAYFKWIKEEGFNAVEIGCRYAHIVDDKFGNLNEEYYHKLEEIIDAAYKYDLYIILTLYDGNDYMWTSLNYDNLESIKKMINTSYQKLVEALNHYDDKLAISFCSEPRNYTTNKVDEESINVLNIVNEEFVKMVRKTGGNNTTRKLVITTGWSKCDGNPAKQFKMVDDDYTIVRVHVYQPGDFANSKTEDKIWIEDDYQITLLNYFQSIKENFIDLNIPVYIGEFGTRPKDNDEERNKWALCYLSLAKSYNVKCFIWDTENKGSGIENSYAISNKTKLEWLNPEYMKYVLEVANGRYVPFYNTYNKTLETKEGFIVPDKVLNLLTNQEEEVIIEFDKTKVDYINGVYYPKKAMTIQFKYTLNDYTYYFEYKFIGEPLKLDFDLELKYYEEKLQCWITTSGYSITRLDYDWISSNEDVLVISKYSTVTIVGDGSCSIIVNLKNSDKYGIIDIIIENGEVISAITRKSQTSAYSE